jgi:nondiscriminating aspartyl-tRNA synthetase
VSRVFAGDLPQHAGERVQIAGRLHRRRRLSQIMDAQAMIAATPARTSSMSSTSPQRTSAGSATGPREHDSQFVFVTGYPMAKRPFYTHPDPRRPVYSNSFDLIFRGLELITGGQRLHRYGDYIDALARAGQDPADYAGYLDAFRFGMPPHGGFAIGLERWVA